MIGTRGAVVSLTSLVTKPHDIPVESDSDADVAEIDLDLTPQKQSSPNGAAALRARSPDTKERRASPGRGDGRVWTKTTHSVKSKSRMKASNVVPRKERHYAMIEADEERLERALTTNAGVIAGERMYHLAQLQQRMRSASQKPAVDCGQNGSPSKKEEKECTFRPALSSGTVRLIEDSGAYRAPCDRFDAQELRLAKARLIQQHANYRVETAECTFKPSVDSVSEALVRRSRSATREPGKAGSRLFDEGRRRLQQQKLIATHIKVLEDQERIGGLLRLGKGDADAVSRRLQMWQQQKDHDIELLRHEEVLSWRPRRARSCDDQAFFSRLHAPPANVGSPIASTTGGVPLSARVRGSAQQNAPSDAAVRVSDRSKQLADELQKIRFRALFAKYVPSGSPDGCVALELVREQVRKLFPHDAGVVDALSHFKPNEPIRREVFVAALCAYERRYGPQSWGRMEHHRLQEEDSDDDIDLHGRRRRPGQPRISAFSEELTARRNRSKPIFEQLIERGKEAEKRRAAKQKELLDEQSRDLTFHPTIHRSSSLTTERRPRPKEEHRPPTTVSNEGFQTPPLFPGSLNVSLEAANPDGPMGTPRPTSIGGRQTACSDEVDELLRSIDDQLVGTRASDQSRCFAPISPRGRPCDAELSHSFLTQSRGPSPAPLPHKASQSTDNGRTPLRKVDWNQSSTPSFHQRQLLFGTATTGTPPSSRKRLMATSPRHSPGSGSRRVVPSFAASADSMLDNIYCEVSVEKRYTQVQQHWSPPPFKSSVGRLQASAHKFTDRRTLVDNGRKPFR